MYQFKRVLWLVVFVFSIHTLGFTQPRPQNKTAVSGVLIDDASQSPLEFATVTILSAEDGSIITGGVTDIDGKFNIQVKPGTYKAKMEYISFLPTDVDVFTVKPGEVYDLGKISLKANAQDLGEVVVRAEKSQMQLSLDKKVFNVGKDLANQGGTASDILDNVPSVTVDIEGEVSLRGNTGVRILVNGKPSTLVNSASGLRSLPANMIEKIEVITNPSARYEAEGMAGIINIVLKKEEKKGINGSFDFTVGYPDQYGVSANLNYRKQKFNFFVNYGVRYRQGPGGGNLYQEFYDGDTTYITQMTRSHVRGGWSNSVRFGSDYYFNKKSILTTAFSYQNSQEDNNSSLEYEDFINDLNNPTGITTRNDDEIEQENEIELAITYRKDFAEKGHNFVFDYRYQLENEAEGSDFTEQYYSADFQPTTIADLIQRSNNEEGELQHLFQADYVKPVGEEGNLEAGLRASFRTISNSYLVEEQENDLWFALDGLSNDFEYNENIYAAYMQYGDDFGKFSYQAGLRYEFSDIITNLKQTNEVNDRKYFSYFPSAFLNYEINESNALQASYSRRLRRPGFRSLNPFFTFSDARNFYSGNPNLDPEFTHSTELGYVKYWEKGSLTSSVYYRNTSNVIQRIRTVDSLGFSTTRPENLSQREDMGFEFTYSLKLVDWWKADGNLNLFRSVTDGGNISDEFFADTYTWFFRVTSMMTINKVWDTQLRFNYRAPRETTQGETQAIYTFDLGVSRDLMNKNATITLSVRDLFNSRRRQSITFGDNFYSESMFQWRQRQTQVTFSYRLNQQKKRGRGGNRGGYGGGGGEEF